ncbi:MAG: hypothetical protein RBT69_06500 [Spirochaetia bacterium]|jgi:hypothetical protein|nr:hypothetical protein [Spirochaetia bacterium]
MNQQQIKSNLQQLADTPDFTVILSGKKSNKVDGLYKPQSREIIIHNKNMKGDNDTMYTAIHEFAHHVHCSSSGTSFSGRCHTRDFWAILHNLLKKAEEKNIYKNTFKNDEDFALITKQIREEYIKKNGELMKELGGLLSKAKQMCIERHLSFDDYTDRELGIHRNIASALISVYGLDISPVIGFENMKTVASVKIPEKRIEAEKLFISRESPDTVKSLLAAKGEALCAADSPDISDDPADKLLSEKKKIIKTIDTLNRKLNDINARLKDLEKQKNIFNDIVDIEKTI